jgi:alpha-L-fucosidase 2
MLGMRCFTAILFALTSAVTYAESGEGSPNQKAVRSLRDARIIHVNSQHPGFEAAKAIDGNPYSIWHSQFRGAIPGYPHEISMDVGQITTIHGFKYLPRQDGNSGWISEYEFYVSDDGQEWGEPVDRGSFAVDFKEKRVLFEKAQEARYVRFVATKGIEGKPYAALAELDIITDLNDKSTLLPAEKPLPADKPLIEGQALDFEARDAAAWQTYRALSDFKGSHVALWWTEPKWLARNRDAVLATIKAVQAGAGEKKAVFLMLVPGLRTKINLYEGGSSHPAYAYLSRDFVAKENLVDTFVLGDHGLKVATLYGVNTSPHVVLIDPEGEITYQGAPSGFAGAISDLLDEDLSLPEFGGTSLRLDPVRANIREQVAALNLRGEADAPAEPVSLWYRQPAFDWKTEALPLGNGSIGAMVFGGVNHERIQFTEETFWSGGPGKDGWKAPDPLGVAEPERWKRDKLTWAATNDFRVHRTLLGYQHVGSSQCYGNSSLGASAGCYQPMGWINLTLEGEGDIRNYRRQLDIRRGLHGICYEQGDLQLTREYFCSNADQVMALRLGSSGPVNMKLDLAFDFPAEKSVEDDVLVGRGAHPQNSLKYVVRLAVDPKDGKLVAAQDGIRVEGGREVTVLMALATDYKQVWPTFRGTDPEAVTRQRLAAARAKPYEKLLADHSAEHMALMDRMVLDFGGADLKALPTDERLRLYKAKGSRDRHLETLLFQFGRYIIVSSSRENSQLPANLQGVWNAHKAPYVWSNFFMDIDLEMNYWAAENSNLGDLSAPLMRFIDTLRPAGREVAKTFFGSRGWTCGYYAGPFGVSSFHARGQYGLWRESAAWLCQNVWDHYAFSGDKEFLKEMGYPIMKGCAEFFLDDLVELDDGTLLICPSSSPENTEHGALVSKGTAYGQSMAWDILNNTIEASEILNVDPEFRKELKIAFERLSPHKVGSKGQLQEWYEDRGVVESRHRHISHLVGLYPGREISVQKTPELAKAASVSMKGRETGDMLDWVAGHKMCLYSRLYEPENAYKYVRRMLSGEGDRILGNLFTTTLEALQIDGNCGYVAGVAEMLIQSHLGEIHILPALPKAWATGSAKGLRARTAVEVDIEWNDMKAVSALVRPKLDGKRKIRAPEGQKIIRIESDGKQVAFEVDDTGAAVVEMTAGASYRLHFGGGE